MTCPKCNFDVEAGATSCPRCGVIFAKLGRDKQRISPSQIVVSTIQLSEPFRTIGPVYAMTTNKHGILDQAARELGIDFTALTSDEFFSALVLGDSTANVHALPVAWTVCLEYLRRQASRLGADAIIGLQMNYDVDRSGGGFTVFTMQLYGTAVRRTTRTGVAR
jgi:uncharacterized protein YbjQ (UPF0145 family)